MNLLGEKLPTFGEKCDNSLNASVHELGVHEEEIQAFSHVSPMNIEKEPHEPHI